ncbi:hypothetical protein [Streptomyces caelestis]|uniref:hypothetical protein n=1 Tax=Streptomyces caelestis TaxID=36816 RepID=UPI0036FEF71B
MLPTKAMMFTSGRWHPVTYGDFVLGGAGADGDDRGAGGGQLHGAWMLWIVQREQDLEVDVAAQSSWADAPAGYGNT